MWGSSGAARSCCLSMACGWQPEGDCNVLHELHVFMLNNDEPTQEKVRCKARFAGLPATTQHTYARRTKRLTWQPAWNGSYPRVRPLPPGGLSSAAIILH
jgi:hypothetical protein